MIGPALPVGRDELFIDERALVADAIAERLQEMVRSIKNVLQDTPPELAADVIDHGIIMTGGGSLLRNIDEMVFRSTGVPAHIAKDAALCVARGTGEALEHLDVYKRSIVAKR